MYTATEKKSRLLCRRRRHRAHEATIKVVTRDERERERERERVE
jgi:hypothetical protein